MDRSIRHLRRWGIPAVGVLLLGLLLWIRGGRERPVAPTPPADIAAEGDELPPGFFAGRGATDRIVGDIPAFDMDEHMEALRREARAKDPGPPRFNPRDPPDVVAGLAIRTASTREIAEKVAELQGKPEGLAREYLMAELVRRLVESPALASEISEIGRTTQGIARKAALYALGRAATAESKRELLALAASGDVGLLRDVVMSAFQEGAGGGPWDGSIVDAIVSRRELDYPLGRPSAEMVLALLDYWNPDFSSKPRSAFGALMSQYLDSTRPTGDSELDARVIDEIYRAAISMSDPPNADSRHEDPRQSFYPPEVSGLHLLAKLPPDFSIEPICLRHLRENPNKIARSAAAGALTRRVLSAEAFDAVAAAAIGDSSEDVRELSLGALQQTLKETEDDQTTRRLLESFWPLLNADSSSRRRRAVVRTFAASPGRSVESLLESVMQSDADPLVANLAGEFLADREERRRRREESERLGFKRAELPE